MSRLRRHQWRRLFASGSPVLLAGGTAMIGVAVAILNQSSNRTNGQPTAPLISWILLAVAIVGVILLVLQWRAEYRKRTYDPTWALKFQDDFLSEETLEIRSKASKELKRLNQPQASTIKTEYSSGYIDDVLDFFEDLGFYLRGDQITPEVAHHAFYYWIQGYYSAVHEYIAAARQTRRSQWECVQELFEITHEVEIQRSGAKATRILDRTDTLRFLDEEIHLMSAKTKIRSVK